MKVQNLNLHFFHSYFKSPSKNPPIKYEMQKKEFYLAI